MILDVKVNDFLDNQPEINIIQEKITLNKYNC